MKLIPTSQGKPMGSDALLLTTSKVWIIGDWYEGAWRTHRSEWREYDGKLVLVSAYQEGDVTHWMPLPDTYAGHVTARERIEQVRKDQAGDQITEAHAARYTALALLIKEIEKLPGSEQQTKCAVLATDIWMEAINGYVDERSRVPDAPPGYRHELVKITAPQETGRMGEPHVAERTAPPASAVSDEELLRTLQNGLLRSGWWPPNEVRRWAEWSAYAQRRFREETGKDLQAQSA